MTGANVNSLFANILAYETTKFCINEDPNEIY